MAECVLRVPNRRLFKLLKSDQLRLGVDEDYSSRRWFEFPMSWAAGGLVSNLTDQCIWMKRLLTTNDILPLDVRVYMRQSTPWADAADNPYGLGLEMYMRGSRLVYGHVGSSAGFHGSTFVDVETGLCVATGTNDFTAHHTVIDLPLWTILDGWPEGR